MSRTATFFDVLIVAALAAGLLPWYGPFPFVFSVTVYGLGRAVGLAAPDRPRCPHCGRTPDDDS